MGCGNKYQNIQEYQEIIKPVCTNKKCTKNLMKLDELNSKFTNLQILELQELQENLQTGEQYKNLKCYVFNEMCNKFSPGENLEITGGLFSQEMPNSSSINFYIDTYHVSTYKPNLEYSYDIQDFYKFANSKNYWNILLSQFAKNIYGLQDIKSGLLLQLFEGVSKSLKNKLKLRGNIHVLLIGDPGTAKSQLLRVVNMYSQGILTSATSTSSAGLTSTAVYDEKSSNKWSIEAGALVLANNKIVCIDELDKIKTSDLYALHQAMEQQTISVAKAGIMITLNAQTSVLAAANPKLGRFNQYQSIDLQITLPITILSRFDLIYMVRDLSDYDMDQKVSKHVLNVHKNISNKSEKKQEFDFKFIKEYIKFG
jgi:replicative DNA helicase Mcm